MVLGQTSGFMLDEQEKRESKRSWRIVYRGSVRESCAERKLLRRCLIFGVVRGYVW